MEITTKRFLLREFTDEDGPAFLAYQSDPRYAQFCTPGEVGATMRESFFAISASGRPNGPGAIVRLPSPISAILRTSGAVAAFVVKVTAPIKQKWESNWHRDTGVITHTRLRSRAL